MFRLAICIFGGFTAFASLTPAAAQTFSSRYTALVQSRCRTLEVIPEGDSVRKRCPGLSGIPLYVNEGDGRSEIDAGMDDGEWESLPGFNRIGDRIEWRLADGRPFAIIYRLRAIPGSEQGAGSTLIVERIGRGRRMPGCRIGLVDGALADANLRARNLADRHARDVMCPAPSAE